MFYVNFIMIEKGLISSFSVLLCMLLGNNMAIHMSMLIEAGFVDIKRESNRIYYIPNKKKIRDFLDELSEALLG